MPAEKRRVLRKAIYLYKCRSTDAHAPVRTHIQDVAAVVLFLTLPLFFLILLRSSEHFCYALD